MLKEDEEGEEKKTLLFFSVAVSRSRLLARFHAMPRLLVGFLCFFKRALASCLLTKESWRRKVAATGSCVTSQTRAEEELRNGW